MPQEGGVKFPKATTTTVQQEQQPRPQVQQPKNNSLATEQAHLTDPEPSSPRPSFSPSPFDASQPSAAHQVAQLCVALGIPAPMYKLERMDAGGEFWGGRADFGFDSAMLPFDVSKLIHAENVLDKKAAKEIIAEDLRKHLVAVKLARDAADQAFLAGGTRGGGGNKKGRMPED